MPGTRKPRLGLQAATLGWIASLFAIAPPLHAEAPYREDAVKAAFLFRFTGYIEWPEATLASGQFTAAVIGSPGVAAELSRLFTRYSVKNLPAQVRAIDTPAQATDVHLLYVGPEYAGSVRELIKAVGTHPVLIVTDEPNGLDEGSVVNFLLVDRRVRFEVSLPAATRVGLRMSSQLLSVAARVRGAQSLRPWQPCMSLPDATTGDRDCSRRVAAL